MPAKSHIQGGMYAGELLPEGWNGNMYRWLGLRVAAVEDRPWPELRAGGMHYQQWSGTVLLPDSPLWLTARWQPSRGEWTDLPGYEEGLGPTLDSGYEGFAGNLRGGAS
jgi:hypothetical protein